MNPKIKIIIAREGLVIFGVVLLGIIIISLNMLCNSIFVKNYVNTPEENRLGWHVLCYAHYEAISWVGICIMFLGYPLYLIIRFIIWAVKTLKEK